MRLPAISAGKSAGEFFITEGEPAALLPTGKDPGFMSCDESSNALSYGMLALSDIHGIPLSMSEAMREYKIEPFWWETALLWASNKYMVARGCGNSFKKTPEPPADDVKNWGRWVSLTEYPISNAASILQNNICRILNNTICTNKDSLARGFYMIQEMLKDTKKQGKDVGYDFNKSSQEHNIPEPGQEGPMSMLRKYDLAVEGTWGSMEIVTSPLTVPVKSAISQLRVKPGLCGAFRFPLRAAIPVSDGRAFGQRKKLPGGTILIDTSGSMNITGEHIHALIENRPAAQIALYSGNGYKGKLNIVAKRGMRTPSPSSCGVYNTCDGPALRWLAKQKGKKVWISDGDVHGYGHTPSINLTIDAAQIVKANKIINYESIDSYMDSKEVAKR